MYCVKVSQFQYSISEWSAHSKSSIKPDHHAHLVLCFAAKEILKDKNTCLQLKKEFPRSEITFCSTAGEIFMDTVKDDTIVIVAMEFEKTTIHAASIDIKDFENSHDAGFALVGLLPTEDLSYIMVFSDGSLVNGSELVKGLTAAAGIHVLISGGLAADADKFKSTLVGLNTEISEGKIIAIGFYGKDLIVTHGSQGGWDTFGLEKEITRSSSNVLYEIDEQNALELYKKYLGPDALNLPGSALLFPLAVTFPGAHSPVVRTILSIDENSKSMTFAGDVPVGSKVRLMKANFDKLTDAASRAAGHTISNQIEKPDFSLLVSCVGRKLVLGPRIEEEVEAVCETIGKNIPIAGFYSYGEISPFNEGGSCQLHNQTMTITSFYELK
jgi:hypothetical protein